MLLLLIFLKLFSFPHHRKLCELEAQNNTMRDELRKLRAEHEQFKVQGFQKNGEYDVLSSFLHYSSLILFCIKD